MATINSVLGPLDTADLGFTLPHEHLIDSSAGIRHTYYELEFRDQALDMALESFTQAKSGGVDTVVEVSPLDLGRDVVLMKEVSEKTGVQFICCTGCWLDVPRQFLGKGQGLHRRPLGARDRTGHRGNGNKGWYHQGRHQRPDNRA